MQRFQPRFCAGFALLGLLTALDGCSSRLYKQQTLILDSPSIDNFTIRYGELEGCVLEQQVPLQYGVSRQHYAMVLRVLPASGGEAPGLEVVIKGQTTLTAGFPDLSAPPAGSVEPTSSRYRLDVAQLAHPRLRIEVFQEGRLLGTETFSYETRECSAFGWG